MNWKDKLTAQLDKNYPYWWLSWSDLDDLRLLVENKEIATAKIKNRVAQKLFHPIIHSAVECGIVYYNKDTEHDKTI
jgi:hypothetical protein